MSEKVDCKYWDKCYQKNPAHHQKYNHPSNILSSSENNKTEPSTSKNKDESLGSSEQFNSDVNQDSTDTKNATSGKSENGSKEIDISTEYAEVIKNLSGKNYFEILQKRVRNAEKAEYDELLKTPEFIRQNFFVEMPLDFYKFWDFCVFLAKAKNTKPENILNNFKLKIVGPFDYLSGNFHSEKKHEPAVYLRHWRFYYDPPEFQTVFVKTDSGLHYGYWRDDPADKENLLMAKNNADQGCEFTFVGGNCFETILYYLDNDCTITPFNKKLINDMKKSIKQYAEENDILLNTLETLKQARDKKVVCKTFHKAGLVVPYDRKTQVGYRPLLESDVNLKKILKRLDMTSESPQVFENVLESLQPIITAANIAMDECDFGTPAELGIDLFCSGYEELHDVISSLIVPAYTMLKRPQFIAIMKAHMENRNKGNKLSIFE